MDWQKNQICEGPKVVGYATVDRIFNPFLLDPEKVDFSVEKAKFLHFLDFPHEWLEYDLYPNELWHIQQKQFEKDKIENGKVARLKEGK